MEFTYKVESYVPDEKRLFVVYTPANTELAPYGNWVFVEDNATEEQIIQNIINGCPLSKWDAPKNTAAMGLLGSSNTATITTRTETVIPQEVLIRAQRDLELTSCDWTQLPDTSLTVEQKEAWAVYRQALRDITDQVGFPDNVNWPVAP